MCHLWCQVTQITARPPAETSKSCRCPKSTRRTGWQSGPDPNVCSSKQSARKKSLKKNHESHAELHQLIGVETSQQLFIFCLLTNSAHPWHPRIQQFKSYLTDQLILAGLLHQPAWGHTHPQETPHLKSFPKSSDFSTHFDSTELWWRRKTKGNSPLTVVLVLKKTPQLAKILDEIKSQISQKWQILKWAKPWI